jgi:hypothetical protein
MIEHFEKLVDSILNADGTHNVLAENQPKPKKIKVTFLSNFSLL